LISRNLDEFGLSAAEFERVRSGLADGFAHKAQVDLELATPKIQALRSDRVAQRAAQRRKDGLDYLARAAISPGAHKTTSGLVIVPIHAGSGASPAAGDSVAVKYAGRLIDGSVFDSEMEHPATFSLSAVIPCWTEALQLMKVGEKDRIVCPPELAYGARGQQPKIAPQSTLDFDVELIAIAPPSP
jgi:FKBP-type peptidyl-prolyl cis-trans isomerase FkpA/FKBP-type peptidyl-prolyl cis-trans isomerase FklB